MWLTKLFPLLLMYITYASIMFCYAPNFSFFIIISGSVEKGNLGVPQLPGQGCSFHSFRTNTYKLNFMETPSGIKVTRNAHLIYLYFILLFLVSLFFSSSSMCRIPNYELQFLPKDSALWYLLKNYGHWANSFMNIPIVIFICCKFDPWLIINSNKISPMFKWFSL